MSIRLSGPRRFRRIMIFRNRKTNYKKHVRDYYIENGVAYISCNVRNIYDIIDPYSVEGYEWLNERFVRFVEENANYIPFEYPILLEICGTAFTPYEEQRIERAIREYYALKLGDMQDEITSTKRKIIGLVAGGILSLLLLIYLASGRSGAPAFISEIVMIFFWFCLWEAGDLLFYDRNEMVYNKTLIAQLESVKIMFSRRFVDTAIDDEEAQQIIEEVFSEAEMGERDDDDDDGDAS